jgi:hypothetical protein
VPAAAVDDQASVAKVDVVQGQGADVDPAGGVHCGQGEDESLLGRGGGGNRLVQVRLVQRQQHPRGRAGQADAAGRVTEQQPAPFAEPKQ